MHFFKYANLRKKKKRSKIWVKYKLYHISNLKDLGLANECPGFTTRGGATEAAEREKCVSYTTFKGKETKERGQRRGRLLTTSQKRDIRSESDRREKLEHCRALGFQGFSHPTDPTMDICGLDSCKHLHTQWLEQAHNRHGKSLNIQSTGASIGLFKMAK